MKNQELKFCAKGTRNEKVLVHNYPSLFEIAKNELFFKDRSICASGLRVSFSQKKAYEETYEISSGCKRVYMFINIDYYGSEQGTTKGYLTVPSNIKVKPELCIEIFDCGFKIRSYGGEFEIFTWYNEV